MNLRSVIGALVLSALTLGSAAQAAELSAKNLYFNRDTLSTHYGTSSRCNLSLDVLKSMSVPGSIGFEPADCTPILAGLQGKDRSTLTIYVTDSLISNQTNLIELPAFDFGDALQLNVDKLKSVCRSVANDMMNIALQGDSAAAVELKIKAAKDNSSIGINGCDLEGTHVVMRLNAMVRTAE